MNQSRTEPYRVAVYAVPGSGKDPYGARLLERAEAWLGRAADGRSIRGTELLGWDRDRIDALTVDARRYGFHGTLKAPFRLARERSVSDLAAAVARFAAGHADVLIPRLTLTRLGSFFALTPGLAAVPLHQLAGEVVCQFEEFRAPLTAEEIARRRPDRLSHRQRELLAAWGYPYVLDEFRFHLTVTDSVPDDRAPEVEAVLRDWFAESLGRDIAIDVLAVFVEPRPGAPFELHSTHPLRPHPAEPTAPRIGDRDRGAVRAG